MDLTHDKKKKSGTFRGLVSLSVKNLVQNQIIILTRWIVSIGALE